MYLAITTISSSLRSSTRIRPSKTIARPTGSLRDIQTTLQGGDLIRLSRYVGKVVLNGLHLEQHLWAHHGPASVLAVHGLINKATLSCFLLLFTSDTA